MNRSGTIYIIWDLHISETRGKHNGQEITNSTTGKHESVCSVSMLIWLVKYMRIIGDV